MKVTKDRSQVETLAPDQICAIIEACASHGVTTIKFGALQIEFGPKAKPASTPGVLVQSEAQPISPVAEMTDTQHAEQTRYANELDEVAIREQQIAELLVTDPEKAEELIRRGELKDADDEPGEFE